jgi:Coenzyme PQQ synthesis protein D (PqqD)
LTQDLLVSRRAELIETEVDGELVALHVDNGTCYGFNSSATRIWALIERPRRVSELRDELTREFDVDPETCERQLGELLSELEADGLVELTAAAD